MIFWLGYWNISIVYVCLKDSEIRQYILYEEQSTKRTMQVTLWVCSLVLLTVCQFICIAQSTGHQRSNVDFRDMYFKILRDLRHDWESPIASLRKRGLIPKRNLLNFQRLCSQLKTDYEQEDNDDNYINNYNFFIWDNEHNKFNRKERDHHMVDMKSPGTLITSKKLIDENGGLNGFEINIKHHFTDANFKNSGSPRRSIEGVHNFMKNELNFRNDDNPCVKRNNALTKRNQKVKASKLKRGITYKNFEDIAKLLERNLNHHVELGKSVGQSNFVAEMENALKNTAYDSDFQHYNGDEHATMRKTIEDIYGDHVNLHDNDNEIPSKTPQVGLKSKLKSVAAVRQPARPAQPVVAIVSLKEPEKGFLQTIRDKFYGLLGIHGSKKANEGEHSVRYSTIQLSLSPLTAKQHPILKNRMQKRFHQIDQQLNEKVGDEYRNLVAKIGQERNIRFSHDSTEELRGYGRDRSDDFSKIYVKQPLYRLYHANKLDDVEKIEKLLNSKFQRNVGVNYQRLNSLGVGRGWNAQSKNDLMCLK